MGEEVLIQFDFSELRHSEIIEFESRMLSEYLLLVNSMLIQFKQKGYTLRLDMGWYNYINGIWSASRLAMVNGYSCYIYCHVEKNGKPVQIFTNDEEADYYMLQAEWNITSITRQGLRLVATLCPSIDDVESDIDKLLSQLPN